MNANQLLDWVNKPATHRQIVGNYAGSYALGVTDNPPAFVLRVEPQDVASFPSKVTIRGVDIPVVVHGSFQPPKPMAASR